MQITVRTATRDDLPALYSFEQGVITAERPFDCTLKLTDTHYYNLDEMITSKDVELVVAQNGNEVVGSGYARIEEAKLYAKHQKYAYFGFMYVIPDYRGRSINKLVIEKLQAWCKQQQVTECRLEVMIKINRQLRHTKSLVLKN